MIRVVRLAGESVDLETGDQLPKALILSNGVREFSLHVDDETAMAVVEMMAEDQKSRSQSTVKRAGSVRVPGNGAAVPPPATTPAGPPGPAAPPPTFESPDAVTFGPEEGQAPAMASVVDRPEDEGIEDDGYEPGEEYNDPATGVESL